MSFAHRLPWFDALATATVLALATLWWPGVAAGDAGALALRGAIVVAIVLAAFYYNDLYDFEAPHEAGELFLRVTRALGYTGLGLAGAYAAFPAIMLDVTATSHALLLALAAVPATRLVVYALGKRPPFAERVLLVGGGTVAAAKLEALLAVGARVTVVAPEIGPAFERPDVTLHRRRFEAGDLDGVWWVVAAAPPEVNRAVQAAAESRQLFVNAADDPSHATAPIEMKPRKRASERMRRAYRGNASHGHRSWQG